MKLLLLFVTIAAAYADFQFFSAREQQGPYQPRGWRPSGPPLALPLRQQLPRQEFSPPPQTYGPPPTYGPPSNEYGPPQTTTTRTTTTESVQDVTTTEVPITTTDNVQEVEQIKSVNKENEVEENNGKLTENDGASQQGVYYIYHPTGLLQRVIFMTKNDAQKMAYSAQLKYENVEPIRDPIYTYDPQTLVLRQLGAQQ